MFKISWNGKPVSAAMATNYLRRMVQLESRGSGDTENALRRVSSNCGLPFWPIWHLKNGRAKTVDADLFAQIRGAYLEFCERQIQALQHELAIERTIGMDDNDLDDLEDEAAELAAKVAAAKARLNDRRRR